VNMSRDSLVFEVCDSSVSGVRDSFTYMVRVSMICVVRHSSSSS